MSSLSLACGQCLLYQRRPRCIVVRQPYCVLEILNQDSGIHLFQTWEKILAGLWLARSTQTWPAFVPLSENIWEQGTKAACVYGMGTWSYYVREKCWPIFLPRRAEMLSRYWLLPSGRRDLVPVSVLVSGPLSFHRTSSDSFLWAQTAEKPSNGFW